MIKISKGNTKLGKISNISLPPVITCTNCEECKKDCYALKSWKQYKNVRIAWTANLTEYLTEPARYFDSISEHIGSNQLKYFRWQVAGDIVDSQYLTGMVRVAEQNPDTSFLAYTKNHEVLQDLYNPDMLPGNLRVVYSAWPGMEIPDHVREYPIAWLSTDDRRHGRQRPVFECSDNCAECLVCFTPGSDFDVVFEKH